MTTFNLLNFKPALLGTLTGTLFLGIGLFSPAQAISLEGLESETQASSSQNLYAQFELPSDGPAAPSNSTGGAVRGSEDDEWEEDWTEEWEEENAADTDPCAVDLEDETLEAEVEETLEANSEVELLDEEVSSCEVELEEAEILEEVEEVEEITLESSPLPTGVR